MTRFRMIAKPAFLVMLVVILSGIWQPTVYAGGAYTTTPVTATPAASEGAATPVAWATIQTATSVVGTTPTTLQMTDNNPPGGGAAVIVSAIRIVDKSSPNVNFSLEVRNQASVLQNTPPSDFVGNFNLSSAGVRLDVVVKCDSQTPGVYTANVLAEVNFPSPTNFYKYTVTCDVVAPVFSSDVVANTININTLDITPQQDAVFTISNTAVVTPPNAANLSGTMQFQVGSNPQISLVGGTPQNFTIAAGTNAAFTARCSPGGTAGTYTAKLQIDHNAPSGVAASTTVVYDIICTATATGTYTARFNAANLAPNDTIDMGNIQAGLIITKQLQILNSGQGSLIVTLSETNANFNLPNPAPGIASAPTNSTKTITVPATPPGNSVLVDIECRPPTASTFTTTLNIQHNAAGVTNNLTYTLQCTGLTPAGIYTSNPAPNTTINLGSALVNTAPEPDPNLRPNKTANQTLVIANIGSTPLILDQISALTFSGTHANDFGLIGLNNPRTVNIAADKNNPFATGDGNKVELQVFCAPTAQGARQAQLNIVYSDGANTGLTQSYPLTCTGTSADAVYASSPANPGDSILIGNGATYTLTIRNNGLGNPIILTPQATLSSIVPGGSTAITLTPPANNTSIAAGGTTTLTLSCNNTSGANVTATLNVNHDAPNVANPATYPVTCSNLAAPAYTSAPTAAGNPISLSNATTTQLTITNTGGATAGNLTLAVNTPPTGLSYSLSKTSVAATGGDSAVLTIACVNATSANITHNLQVTHNGTGSPATYAVTCTPTVTTNIPILQVSLNSNPGVAISSATIVSNLNTQGSVVLRLANIGAGTLIFAKPGSPSIAAEINPAPSTSQPIGFSTSSPAIPDLLAGQLANVTIVCTPTSNTTFTASVIFYSNSNNNTNTTTSITITCDTPSSGTGATSTAAAASGATSTAAAAATSTPIPAVSSNQVTPCSNNQVLSLPFPQNASGEFLLVNCYVVSTAGTVNVSLQQVLTNPSTSVTDSSLATIQANAGLMSVWRMGSWFLTPSTYNAATQTYSFDAIAGTNIYVFFYGGITQPVGSQSGTFITTGGGVVPGTTTGDVTDIILDEDSPALPLILSTLAIAFVMVIYASRRFNSRRKNTIT